MEIQNKGGFEVVMPEKSQQQKFSDEKKKDSEKDGVVLNKKRSDAGTRGHVDGGDPDMWMSAEIKKKREELAGRQDIVDADINLNTKLSNAREIKEEIEDRREALENAEDFEEGYDEFRFLSKDGVARIDDETEFSDGRRADGTYRDGYWFEPTDEEVAEFDSQNAQETADGKKKAQFYGDRGNSGKRGKGRWFR